MKKVLFATLAFLPIFAFSKDTHVTIPMPVICDTSEKVIAIMKEFDEKIIFVGLEESNSNTVSVWRNDTTGTFTMTITPKGSDYTCVISAGSTSRNI
jgi:hypothetical protein